MDESILMIDYQKVEFRVLASFARKLAEFPDFNSEILYQSLIAAKDSDKRSFLMMSYGSLEGEVVIKDLMRSYLNLGYI